MSSYNHITTVIFDMDGTLIEHTWRMSYLCQVLFEPFAEKLAPVTQDDFFECYWSKSVDTWFMMADGVLDGKTAHRYSFINTLRALEQDIDLADALADTWIELVLKEAIPFDDTNTVLDAVRQHYKTGILTNGFTYIQRQKIDKYQLADRVDFTVVSEETGYHKPDQRVFAEMLKLAGNVSPEETLYVGDNLVNDIQGAQGAGITPILMNPRDNHEPPEGVAKIRQLSELLALLEI